MNKWFDNIILHPKTHSVLFAYNGEFPHEQRSELLKDCAVCETEDIICYAYYHAIWKRVMVLIVNKYNTDKYFNWLCGTRLPTFKLINNILCATDGSTPYMVRIFLTGSGRPLVETLHTPNNWNQIKNLNNV